MAIIRTHPIIYIFLMYKFKRDRINSALERVGTVFMGHYQKMEKFRKAKSKKYEKKKSPLFRVVLNYFIDTGMGK